MPRAGLGSSSCSSSSSGGGGGVLVWFGGGGRGGQGGRRRGEGGREGLAVFVAHVEEHPHTEFGQLGGEEELEGEGGMESVKKRVGKNDSVRTSLPI